MEIENTQQMEQQIYDPKVHPAWARSLVAAGYDRAAIASEMGIDSSTLRSWKAKYQEFSEAVEFGQKVALARIEQAMFDRAVGYEYLETEHVEEYDEAGEGKTRDVKRTKHMAADVNAQKAYLAAFNPKRWTASSIGIAVDEAGNPLQAPSINITFVKNDANAIQGQP